MDRPNRAVAESLASGLAGALTLTLIHETARRAIRDAPRMDTLGRRALARGMDGIGVEPPPRGTLQGMALAGDVVANSLYYALVGVGSPGGAWLRGAALGALAGLGAVVLPPRLGLGEAPGAANPRTRAMTFAWYLAGGLASAAAFRRLASEGTMR